MNGTLPATAVVQADFDRIAGLARPDATDRWSAWVIGRVPIGCEAVLEVGAGTGAVARRVAEKAQRVVALDLSPEMVRVARRCSAMHANLEFQQSDFMSWTVPGDGFDVVVSMATLHHLPMESGLARLAAAVRPGGSLLVVDLFDTRGLGLLPYNAISYGLRVLSGGRRPDPELAAAWRAHEDHDHHLPMREIRRTAARVLPGARVRRHLGWRYSLEWRRAPNGGC